MKVARALRDVWKKKKTKKQFHVVRMNTLQGDASSIEIRKG